MTKETKIRIWEKKCRINELKKKLSETDYQAIKFSEGEMTANEYAPIREKRKQWRVEINSLERIIKILKGE